jgi:putative phosphoribosyl transferase
MQSQVKKILQNRKHAGRLLAEKLSPYKNSDAIVLAVPQGGVPVGREIANALHLPFEIIFSKRIKDPANSDISIGAVSLDEVVLQESTKFIPQSYIYHQITMIQKMLQTEFNKYYSDKEKKPLTDKTVIIVDDVLRETEELTACLLSVRKQNPKNIIIAAPVGTIKAANLLAEEEYQFVYLFMEFSGLNKAYTYFSELDQEESSELILSGHLN